MRKGALYGLAVVCVCLLFAVSGPEAQRIAPSPDAAASRPTQVEVTNFPTVQEVVGTVNVGNLPVDAEGNVKVTLSSLAPVVRFIGFTDVTFEAPSPFAGPLSFSRACDSEFPGSRICEANEVLRSIPIVAEFTQSALIFLPSDPTTVQAKVYCVNADGQVGSCPGGLLPVACCGY
jgi:hypothetical protein